MCHVLSCSVMSNSCNPLWTAALQGPLSMGFPRKEYWSGLPFPSPGDLPKPRMEPVPPEFAGTREARPVFVHLSKPEILK